MPVRNWSHQLRERSKGNSVTPAEITKSASKLVYKMRKKPNMADMEKCCRREKDEHTILKTEEKKKPRRDLIFYRK